MPTPREMTYPITLSRAELAFLLSLLDVPQLIGVTDDALFPSDPATRDTLFTEGKAQLEAAGWLTWQADQHAYHLDEALLAISIALAFPQVVVTFRLDTPPTTRRGVTCAISNDLVVELAQIDDQYQINVIASVDLLAQRLVHVLDLPQQHAVGEHYTITRTALDALRRDPHHPARHSEMPQTFTQQLGTTLATLRSNAAITLLQVRESQVVGVRLLGVLTGSTADAWMLVPDESDLVQVTAIGADDLVRTLANTISDLRPSA